jgi:quercetin dioxygenase-like cupin family protein
MNDTTYTYFRDLAAEATVPRRGIHSQTLSDEGGVELVLFALAAGERLSEHTSARPAVIHILSGEAELTAAGDSYDAGPGAWLRLPIRMAHAVIAKSELVFALYLLPA